MDLRRRTTQGLAAAGALLIVAGLSLGGGVAVAAPPAEPAKATTTSSDQSDKQEKQDKQDKKSSKSKKSTTTTSTDSMGSGSSDSSTGSTATTAPPWTASTATTATTATTSTTRPTATSAPTTTATTSASSNSTPSEGSADTPGGGSGGTYDGKPITAAEDDDSTTTTLDDGPGSDPPSARKPASRSGSGMPPGIYPVEPGARTANSPSPSPTPAPAAPVLPNPPIVVTETQPAQQTTSTTSAAASGTAGGGTETSPASDVRGADQVQEESPASARQSRQLGQTGDGTRRLIIFGGVALLIGAVVVGFTGRDGPLLAAAAPLPAAPVRRRPKRRPKPPSELDGWESGIPHSPTKRELTRNRLGISAESYYDDELGV